MSLSHLERSFRQEMGFTVSLLYVGAIEEESDEHAPILSSLRAARSSRAACAAGTAGCAPGGSTRAACISWGRVGYALCVVGPKVNRASIILGIVGWVLVGLTVLGTWLLFEPSRPMLIRAVLTSSAFYLLGMPSLGSGEPSLWALLGSSGQWASRRRASSTGWESSSVRAVRRFLALMMAATYFTRPPSCGSSHASMMIDGARPTCMPEGRTAGRAYNIAAMANS